MTKIKLDPGRLVVLDRIARQRRATAAGLADRLADLRDQRQDLKRREGMIGSRMEGDPRNQVAFEEQMKEIEAERNALASQIAEAEAEHGSVAASATVARINLSAALDLARGEGLAIPSGLAVEVA